MTGTQISKWWAEDPAEVFWLEVGDRGEDLGVDLNAPTENERGGSFWSYDLVHEVDEGDVVLHYDREEHAIVGWSIAVGSAWPDTVLWAARGTFARGANIQPHERPGMRLSLNGPVLLARPLSLDRIREARPDLERIRLGRKYFPFELGSRPAGPVQGYLFKLPAAFVDLFSELDEVPRRQQLGARLPSPARRVNTTATTGDARSSFHATRTSGPVRRDHGCETRPRLIELRRPTRGSSGSSPRLLAPQDGGRRGWAQAIHPSTSCSDAQMA